VDADARWLKSGLGTGQQIVRRSLNLIIVHPLEGYVADAGLLLPTQIGLIANGTAFFCVQDAPWPPAASSGWIGRFGWKVQDPGDDGNNPMTSLVLSRGFCIIVRLIDAGARQQAGA
jgi:hypothetical protein